MVRVWEQCYALGPGVRLYPARWRRSLARESASAATADSVESVVAPLELGIVADEEAEAAAVSGSSSKIIRSASGSFLVATLVAGFVVEEAAEDVDVLDFAADVAGFDADELEELVDFVDDLAEATVEFTVLADF